MTTLTERLARLVCEAQGVDPDAPPKAGKPSPAWRYETDYALAAIRAVLAEMREHFRGDPRLIEGIVDDFARHHGLDPPPAEEQQP